jgi:D-methionine transport system ATP-binding protein
LSYQLAGAIEVLLKRVHNHSFRGQWFFFAWRSDVIELKSINKAFSGAQGRSIEALKDVNLLVPQGHIHGVIGRSGAGKSTLLRCVNLLERPDSGSVQVAGQALLNLDAEALREARRKIGMIFQHFNLLSTQTVSSNIAFPLRLAGFSVAEQKKRVTELLDRVGLSDKAQAYPGQLSGGQKQRVAIARALATKPSILLCDEMTSALDPESTQSILDLVREIQAELSLTVLLITHEMDVIKRITDEVTVMDQAGVIEQGETGTIFSAPQHAVTRQLVDSTEHMVLPDGVKDHLVQEQSDDSVVLLELSFCGETAARPVISASVQKFGVDISILQANLSYLRDTLVGKMIVGCHAPADAIQQVELFYRESGINVERLGYVKRDNWPFC